MSNDEIRNKINDLYEEVRKMKEEIERIDKSLQELHETSEEVLLNLNFEAMPKLLDKNEPLIEITENVDDARATYGEGSNEW